MTPSERMAVAAHRIDGLIAAAGPGLAAVSRGIGPVAERLADCAALGELGTEASDVADRVELLGHAIAELVQSITNLATAVTWLGAISNGETTLASLIGTELRAAN